MALPSQGLAAAQHGLSLFLRLGLDGTLDRIHDALYEKCREQAEREAGPSAAIIDSQSVRSAQKRSYAGGRRPDLAGRASTPAWRQPMHFVTSATVVATAARANDTTMFASLELSQSKWVV